MTIEFPKWALVAVGAMVVYTLVCSIVAATYLAGVMAGVL